MMLQLQAFSTVSVLCECLLNHVTFDLIGCLLFSASFIIVIIVIIIIIIIIVIIVIIITTFRLNSGLLFSFSFAL